MRTTRAFLPVRAFGNTWKGRMLPMRLWWAWRIRSPKAIGSSIGFWNSPKCLPKAASTWYWAIRRGSGSNFRKRNSSPRATVKLPRRRTMINQLSETNPGLASEFADAKHDAEAGSKFVRSSGRFPLTAIGDVNTYALFADLFRRIMSPRGGAGALLPIGIATDDTTKAFFGDVVEKRSLSRLIGFENEAFIFPAVHHSFKFCAFTLRGHQAELKQADFAFFCRYFDDVRDDSRHFKLTREDFHLINPNTLTCPVFRTRADAELTKMIYQRVPVLINERTGENPWGIKFLAMFHMANDSHLFQTTPGEGLVPLYEAKMIYQFEHRYGTYEGATQAQLNVGSLPRPTPDQLADSA